MKINRSIVDARWVDFEPDKEVSFLIRQMPLSIGMWMPNSDEDFMQFTKKRFMYCVQDWKGIIDENEEEFPYNDENKEFIFDYVQEISLWVTGQLADNADNIVEKKTLSSTPSGSIDQLDLLVKSVKS